MKGNENNVRKPVKGKIKEKDRDESLHSFHRKPGLKLSAPSIPNSQCIGSKDFPYFHLMDRHTECKTKTT